jgi:hypothetical protein
LSTLEDWYSKFKDYKCYPIIGRVSKPITFKVILSLIYFVSSFLLFMWLFFFTYALLAIVYVSHVMRICIFYHPLFVICLSKHHHHHHSTCSLIGINNLIICVYVYIHKQLYAYIYISYFIFLFTIYLFVFFIKDYTLTELLEFKDVAVVPEGRLDAPIFMGIYIFIYICL